MAPADEFVEDFVGADRALKRLALMRVSDVDLWEAPLAFVGQDTAEVRAKLEGAEVPWAAARRLRAQAAGLAVGARPRGRHGPAATRHLARAAARPRRRPPRRALRPAPGRRPTTRRWSTPRGAIAGILSIESSRTSSPPTRRRSRSTRQPSARWAERRARDRSASLLAQVEIRASPGPAATTCEGKNETFCPGYVARQHRRLRLAAARAHRPRRSARCRSASCSRWPWRSSPTAAAG